MKRLLKNTALILALTLLLPVFVTGCKKKSDKGDDSWYDARTIEFDLRYDASEYEQLTTKFVGLIGDKAIIHVNYYNPFPDGFDYMNGDISPYQGDSVEIYDLEGKLIKSLSCKELAGQKDIVGGVSGDLSISGDKLLIPYEMFDVSGQSKTIVIYVDVESGNITGTYEKDSSGKHLNGYVTSGGYTAYAFGKFEDRNFQELEIVSEDGSTKTVQLNGADVVWDSGYPMVDIGDGMIIVPYMNMRSGIWNGIGYFTVDLKNATSRLSDDDLLWAGGYDYVCNASWVKGLGVACADEDGLFRMDFGGKKTERILNYDRCDANLFLLRRLKLFSSDNGRYIFGGSAYLENYTDTIAPATMIILQRSDNDQTKSKTELTAASFDLLDYNTAEVVLKFNRASSEYHISFDPQYYLSAVADYKGNSSEENSELKARMKLVDKLKVDILAGEGPDIILNGLSDTGSLESVIFADLSNDIPHDGCFENVFEACKSGGKLYTVPLSFQVSGICTDSVYVKDGQKGFTFDEYEKFVKTVCNGTDPIELDNMDYFGYIFSTMYSSFVQNGTDPDFNTPEFKALAQYVCNNVTYTYPQDPEFIEKTLDDKTHALSKNFSSILAYAGAFDHETHKTVVLGYPSATGTGPVLNIINSVSVSASSKNKAGAVEFIKFLLSEEMQTGYSKSVFSMPVRISSYEESSKIIIEQYNKQREDVIKMGVTDQDLLNMGFQNSVSMDEIGKFEDVIKTAESVYRFDPAVVVIMREEMPAYFKGQKSLDDVIVIVNSRVKTYLSERSK